MPQDSQTPALLELGTTSMLHAYWLPGTDEANSFWYQMTSHFSILDSIEAIQCRVHINIEV